MTISKYQALKIIYRALGMAVEGVVGEGGSFSLEVAQIKGEVRECELT